MKILRTIIATILPPALYTSWSRPYHFLLSLAGAIYYRFPARKLTVIAVTGTKGKSSVTYLLGKILASAGKKTAVASTIEFSDGENTLRNLTKMTLPGRSFIQKLLRQAVDNGATHAVIEITSEATLQYRHLFLFLNGLIFTNLSPEHIESHGSFEAYRNAKQNIGRTLVRSHKRPKYVVVNEEDPQSAFYRSIPAEHTASFSLSRWDASGITTKIPGQTIRDNMLAAREMALLLGIPDATIRQALSSVAVIPGRQEEIENVVVDYAHTADSLEKLYRSYPERKVCVLGSTGGGRDSKKRPIMGAIADSACEMVIVTNEDPYDEDPEKIVREVASGVTSKKPVIILDRRKAIQYALENAQGQRVIISGKGTDPYIMGPKGTKTPWDDRDVVREILNHKI